MPGLRVDAGVAEGGEVGIHYDPMLAKVVAWGQTRDEAADRLSGALRRFGVQGVATNREFLIEVLDHPAFRAGALSTHFIADHFPEGWAPPARDRAADHRAAVAAALFDAEARRAAIPHVPGLRPGWRNNPFRPQDARYLRAPDGHELRVDYTALGAGRYAVQVHEGGPGERWTARVLERTRRTLRLDIDGLRERFVVVTDGDRRWVRGPAGAFVAVVAPRFPAADAAASGGGCAAPMPGRVVKVLVAEGQAVAAGAPLVILEAMKMEQTLTAPTAGTVRALRCAVGDLVEAGAPLVDLEPAEEN
jgi:propionyl-CoA carboxylase alpha chain